MTGWRWGVIPMLHCNRTAVLGGNPEPVAIVTIPGGPMGGSSLTLASDAVPRRRAVRGEPVKASATGERRGPGPGFGRG